MLATLEARAVNDLTHVEVEQVVNQQRLMKAIYALCGVVVVFCLYFAFAPKSILDSARRAFLADVVRPTNTQLVNIKPGERRGRGREQVNFSVDVDRESGRRRSSCITASTAASSSPSRNSSRATTTTTPGSSR